MKELRQNAGVPREVPVEKTCFTELDAACVEKVGQKFRDLVPAERIEAMRDLPTTFERSPDFERAYKAATGVRPERSVTGFSTHLEALAHVRVTDLASVAEDDMHERIHQISDPRSEQLLGKALNEGITQDLALETLGAELEPGDVTGYAQERVLAHRLREICGDEAVYDAYFKGDGRRLNACLDRNLGHNANVLAERTAQWPDLKS